MKPTINYSREFIVKVYNEYLKTKDKKTLLSNYGITQATLYRRIKKYGISTTTTAA